MLRLRLSLNESVWVPRVPTHSFRLILDPTLRTALYNPPLAWGLDSVCQAAWAIRESVVAPRFADRDLWRDNDLERSIGDLRANREVWGFVPVWVVWCSCFNAESGERVVGESTACPKLANGFDCSLFGVVTRGVFIREDFAVCDGVSQ